MKAFFDRAMMRMNGGAAKWLANMCDQYITGRRGYRDIAVTNVEDTESDPRGLIISHRKVCLPVLCVAGNSSVVTVVVEGTWLAGVRPKPDRKPRCQTVMSVPVLEAKVEVGSSTPGMSPPLVIRVTCEFGHSSEVAPLHVTIGETRMSYLRVPGQERSEQPAAELEALTATLEQATADVIGRAGCLFPVYSASYCVRQCWARLRG
jgi:hypothetical protein